LYIVLSTFSLHVRSILQYVHFHHSSPCPKAKMLHSLKVLSNENRDSGHEQLTSNGERFKPAFAERVKKQTMIDLGGISTNWFKNQLCSSIRLSVLRALRWVETGLNRSIVTNCLVGFEANLDRKSHFDLNVPVLTLK
jgi:hypothetical protein